MRPRHYTAENLGLDEVDAYPQDLASMRPRHYTAENHEVVQRLARRQLASMRPRHYTAENLHYTGLSGALPGMLQ